MLLSNLPGQRTPAIIAPGPKGAPPPSQNQTTPWQRPPDDPGDVVQKQLAQPASADSKYRQAQPGTIALPHREGQLRYLNQSTVSVAAS